jgi:hypothetical protein
MALWWIKGVQRESDEAIEYLLEADSEALAKMKADRHGIEVAVVKPYQGSTEMQAIRVEINGLREDLGYLRRDLMKSRNPLRDKPIRTIGLGVALGLWMTALIVWGIGLALSALDYADFLSAS